MQRALRLLRAYRAEQTDPDHFYSALAADSVAQLAHFVPLEGRTVLDVGGGPGYFGAAFREAGARYIAVDADVGELSVPGGGAAGSVLGSGLALPVRTGVVDVAYSSNVLEHVPDPWRMADEMLRVTRPGGTVFLSYTSWYSPHGGHETGPWHYLGGHVARRRYARTRGAEPKNRYGETLFRVTVAGGLRWARRSEQCGLAHVVAAFPRYHPWWAAGVVRVPAVRELLTWNLALVLRRTGRVDLPRAGTAAGSVR